MKKILYSLSVLLWLVLSGVEPSVHYDIVVYGGGFAGCATARNAAALAPDKKILLIVPESESVLGGLGTAGGQNFTDIRFWKGDLVTAGSFERWYTLSGQFYNTQRLSAIIKADLAQFPQLKIVYATDIKRVWQQEGVIQKLRLDGLFQGDTGTISWRGQEKLVQANVFVDASDDGRLARLSGAYLSIGRSDWPTAYQTSSQSNGDDIAQQAATLMFKVKGIQTPDIQGPLGGWEFVKDAYGSWGLAGGKEIWSTSNTVKEFNETYGPLGFSIKPINAAQDGLNSGEWWVNTLLIYHVDGRARERDRNTGSYPQETLAGHRSVDQAWQAGRAMLENPDFMRALRAFKIADGSREYGFGQAELVRDERGQPVVGEILYIRESVHGQQKAISHAQGTEDSLYALTRIEAQRAGDAPDIGADRGNYDSRIGLAYYLMDINAYHPEDLKVDGRYFWPVTPALRPDWLEDGGQPTNPVYLPWEMLVGQPLKNLVVPGYATSCASFAWSELRVLPNLAVLGDAAGVGAARAVLFNEKPSEFTTVQIDWVQSKLRELGARLDK